MSRVGGKLFNVSLDATAPHQSHDKVDHDLRSSLQRQVQRRVPRWPWQSWRLDHNT